MRNNMNNLGKVLRSLRRQRGFTQEQLAERADLHPTYIAKIEAGERLPSLDTLVSLSNVLQAPLHVIMERVESQVMPGVVHDGVQDSSEDLQQIKREITYMVEDLNLEEGLLVRDILRLVRTHIQK
ncbi:MAG TPA: helix-turn-helix transcriptional regulator [Firmicutes bacterium]|jgi:transcriptional regulator with XRE-family HTH domain|nr:helix-turn-helix transcriptional regulator [Bacillota bacterium]